MEQLLAYSLNRTIGPIKTHTKYFVKWNLDHFPTQEEYWQDDDLSLEDWLKLWEPPPATREVEMGAEEPEERTEPA